MECSVENHVQGLRRIKTRSENLHLWKWPCFYIFAVGALIAPFFPPLAILAPIGAYLWLFFHYRLLLSKCPRCSNRFYSPFNILFQMGYYTKSGMWAVQCKSCQLSLSELPEVEEIKIKSHKDEWLK